MRLGQLTLLLTLLAPSFANPLPYVSPGANASEIADPRLQQRGIPLIPYLDKFYTPPKGWEDKPLGSVLRSRKINVFFPLALNVEAWQLLYRTSGPFDEPLSTVTTVFRPPRYDPGKLAVFQSAEDACSTVCAPSYIYQRWAVPTDFVVEIEVGIISAALSMGWFVSSADYEGPNSAFGAGRLAGRGILDSTRAILNFAHEIELQEKPRTVMFGYSGGALGTAWASALHPTYAPELEIVGFAYGGTPANLTHLFEFLDGSLFSGFVLTGMVGLSRAYPDVAKFIADKVTWMGRASLFVSGKLCVITSLLAFPFRKVQSRWFSSDGKDVLQDPQLRNVLEQQTLGAVPEETPIAPLFIYHAKHDQVIPEVDATTMVDSWCNNGVKSLEYTIDIGVTEHASELIVGLSSVLTWLEARLNGNTEALPKGCKRNEIETQYTVKALGEAVKPILAALELQLRTFIGIDDDILNSKIKNEGNSTDPEVFQGSDKNRW